MNLKKAREILEQDNIYDYKKPLSKVERLVIFEAVAKRVGRHIDFYAGHDLLYIGEFEWLTKAMFEEEFMLLVKSGCFYDEEQDGWAMYT
jgi:hypothetical protein